MPRQQTGLVAPFGLKVGGGRRLGHTLMVGREVRRAPANQALFEERGQQRGEYHRPEGRDPEGADVMQNLNQLAHDHYSERDTGAA
jgi:hypothetical protein